MGADADPAAGTSVRARLAWRRALALVSRRVPRRPRPMAERHLLVVLPTDEAAAHDAWEFVRALGWPPEQVFAVAPESDHPPTPPADFIGRVTVIGAKERGLLRLPKRAVRERVWASEPDLALYLRHDLDLGLALLVAASPAALRAGLFSEAVAPLFDLAALPGPAGLHTLEAVLRRVQPAAVPQA